MNYSASPKYSLFSIILLLFFSSTYIVKGQNQDSFNLIYDKISKKIAHEDLGRALILADSLLLNTTLPENQIKCHVLIARLYQQKEELDKAVEFSQKAAELAHFQKNYLWQARANGHLAGLYRIMGFQNKAKHYLEVALEAIPQISDKEKAKNTAGLMQQELAFCNMDEDNYEQAIHHLNLAKSYFDQIIENKDFLMMNNERLLGQSYYYLKKYDTALVHLKKALHLSSGRPTNYIIGMIHTGMAETYLELNELKKAKFHLDQAEKIAKESQYLQIKAAIYSISKEYYRRTANKDKLIQASEKKVSLDSQINYKQADLLDKVSSNLEKKEIRTEKLSRRQSQIIYFLSTLLFVSMVYLYYIRRRRKSDIAHFRKIIDQMAVKGDESEWGTLENIVPKLNIETEATAKQSVVSDELAVIDKSTLHPSMAEETMHKLLEGLDNFEQDELYLKKNMSISSLASYLNTNQKYLSQVILDQRKMNFNSYINHLRVNYVIDKLVKNPEWRLYKINYLADVTGFSSHSQFAAVFKSIKGLSPSTFIQLLETNKE